MMPGFALVTPGTARILITMFLDNWENSRCWDAQVSESKADAEVATSGASHPVALEERLNAEPEPLALNAGARLDLLDISVRFIDTADEAEQVVRSLVDTAGHFGLDVETAKLAQYAYHGQAGLNPHMSRIRLFQLYAGGFEAFVIDLFAVPPAILRPLLAKQFVAHNAVFELQHLIHAGLEPGRIECTMLQANALTGKRPKLAALAEAELGWRISKEQQVSDWSAPILSQ